MRAQSQIKSKADQVVDRVIALLRGGTFNAGDKLPSERHLAREFGVSLLTVNKAMVRLEDAGVLSRSAGRGTHVVSVSSGEAVAVIFDVCHLTEPRTSGFFSLQEPLLSMASKEGFAPHFLVGAGKNAREFLDSLSFHSPLWGSVKGAVAMGWREGAEDAFAKRGIPLVTISTKNQGGRSVIIDYDELGRMAASLILKRAGTGRGVVVVHNKSFSEDTWNNPVRTFMAGLEKGGFDLSQVSAIPTEVSPETGFGLGKELSETDCDIFFTDEHLAAGFSSWTEANPGAAARRIITQMSLPLRLSIPASYDRLAFSSEKICAEAFKLLRDTLSGRTEPDSPVRRRVKPALLEGTI
jgi:hypothetical protein